MKSGINNTLMLYCKKLCKKIVKNISSSLIELKLDF